MPAEGDFIFSNHRAPSCHYRGGRRRETIGRREVFRGKRAGVVSEARRDGGRGRDDDDGGGGGKAGPGKGRTHLT